MPTHRWSGGVARMLVAYRRAHNRVRPRWRRQGEPRTKNRRDEVPSACPGRSSMQYIKVRAVGQLLSPNAHTWNTHTYTSCFIFSTFAARRFSFIYFRTPLRETRRRGALLFRRCGFFTRSLLAHPAVLCGQLTIQSSLVCGAFFLENVPVVGTSTDTGRNNSR